MTRTRLLTGAAIGVACLGLAAASGWAQEHAGRLFAGPGLEIKTRRPGEEGEPEGGHGIAQETVEPMPEKEDNLFLWRFGAAHVFPVGKRYAVAPHVELDLVREDGQWVEAVVFSLSIGFDF